MSNYPKKNKELEQKLLNQNKEKDNIINLMNKIIEKDEEIKQLKSVMPFEIRKGEKLISVIFRSVDQNILYSIICKNTDKFTTIENLLYEEYPKYRDSENIFLFNGKTINKYLSLEENNIINSAIIMLNQIK